jgi:hypothetical protein
LWLLRLAGQVDRAYRDARKDAAEEDALHYDADLDDPRLDSMTPAEISFRYRDKMSVFERRAAG